MCILDSLGVKLMPTVPYFRSVCLAGLFYPVAMVAYNVLKVKCKGSTIVRLEILKKAIMTVLLALTIPRSVQAVVWGLVAFAFCEMLVNVGASLRVAHLSGRRFVRSLLPVALVSGAMYLAVRGVAACWPHPSWPRFFAEISTGAATYLLLSLLFRLEALSEVWRIIRRR